MENISAKRRLLLNAEDTNSYGQHVKQKPNTDFTIIEAAAGTVPDLNDTFTDPNNVIRKKKKNKKRHNFCDIEPENASTPKKGKTDVLVNGSTENSSFLSFTGTEDIHVPKKKKKKKKHLNLLVDDRNNIEIEPTSEMPKKKKQTVKSSDNDDLEKTVKKEKDESISEDLNENVPSEHNNKMKKQKHVKFEDFTDNSSGVIKKKKKKHLGGYLQLKELMVNPFGVVINKKKKHKDGELPSSEELIINPFSDISSDVIKKKKKKHKENYHPAVVSIKEEKKQNDVDVMPEELTDNSSGVSKKKKKKHLQTEETKIPNDVDVKSEELTDSSSNVAKKKKKKHKYIDLQSEETKIPNDVDVKPEELTDNFSGVSKKKHKHIDLQSEETKIPNDVDVKSEELTDSSSNVAKKKKKKKYKDINLDDSVDYTTQGNSEVVVKKKKKRKREESNLEHLDESVDIVNKKTKKKKLKYVDIQHENVVNGGNIEEIYEENINNPPTISNEFNNENHLLHESIDLNDTEIYLGDKLEPKLEINVSPVKTTTKNHYYSSPNENISSEKLKLEQLSESSDTLTSIASNQYGEENVRKRKKKQRNLSFEFVKLEDELHRTNNTVLDISHSPVIVKSKKRMSPEATHTNKDRLSEDLERTLVVSESPIDKVKSKRKNHSDEEIASEDTSKNGNAGKQSPKLDKVLTDLDYFHDEGHIFAEALNRSIEASESGSVKEQTTVKKNSEDCAVENCSDKSMDHTDNSRLSSSKSDTNCVTITLDDINQLETDTQLSSCGSSSLVNDNANEDLSPGDEELLRNLVVMIDFPIPELHKLFKRCSKPTRQQNEKIAALGLPVKKGKFTIDEDETIRKNWQDFIRVHNLPNKPKLFFSFRDMNLKQLPIGLQARVRFCQFIARGLGNRTLFQVHERFKVLFKTAVVKKGRFTQAEDVFIAEYMKSSKSQTKRADLAKSLGRSITSIAKRTLKLDQPLDLLRNYNKHELPGIFLKYLLRATKCENYKELRDREITPKEWTKLQKILNTFSMSQLKYIWECRVYPALFIESDMRKVDIERWTIERMHENNETDWKCVDWVKYSDPLPGITSRYLYFLIKLFLRRVVPKVNQTNLIDTLAYIKNRKSDIFKHAEEKSGVIHKMIYLNGKLIKASRNECNNNQEINDLDYGTVEENSTNNLD